MVLNKYILFLVLVFLFSAPLAAKAYCNKEYHRELCVIYETEDFQTEFRRLLLAASKGDTEAQTSLGTIYDTGAGVKPDKEEAIKWYRLAAENGDTSAQYSLASILYSGKSVAGDYGAYKNKGDALKWYKEAAKNGDISAQLALGGIYRLDYMDRENALKWYRMAADNGDQDAQKLYEEITKEIAKESNE